MIPLQHPGRLDNLGHKGGSGQQIRTLAKLGPETAEEVVHVSCDDAADLQRNQARAHEQRRQQHTVGHSLRRYGKEEETGFLAALVLYNRVAHGRDESLEEASAADEVAVHRNDHGADREQIPEDILLSRELRV